MDGREGEERRKIKDNLLKISSKFTIDLTEHYHYLRLKPIISLPIIGLQVASAQDICSAIVICIQKHT